MTPSAQGVPTEGARARPAAPAACLRALAGVLGSQQEWGPDRC